MARAALFKTLYKGDLFVRKLSGIEGPLDLTAEALRSLGVEFDYFDYASFGQLDLSRYTHLIFGEEWGGPACRRLLVKWRRKIEEFVNRGGIIVALRSGFPAEKWLPPSLPLRTDRGEGSYPVIVKPEHPLVRRPHDLLRGAFDFFRPPPRIRYNRLWDIGWGGRASPAFSKLGRNWTALDRLAVWRGEHPEKPHHALLVGKCGKGVIVLCQYLPAFTYAGRDSLAGGELLHNILEFVGIKAEWGKRCWRS